MLRLLCLRNWQTRRRLCRPPAMRLFLESLEDRVTPTLVTFHLISDWGAAFNGEITIRNTGSAEINNWHRGFAWARQIAATCDASIVSHAGNHYEVRNAGWNGTIAIGGTATFGLSGTPGNVTDEPINYDVHSAAGPGGEVPATP